LLRPVPGLQASGAQTVQVARHPVAVVHQGPEGLLGEERSPRQGYPGHALADIRQALGLGQGSDRGGDPNALRHAAQPPAPQVLLQRGLPDQDNLQEGLLGSSQGRQQGQLREGLQGEVLRLIDEECHRAPLLRLVPEALLQLGQHSS
jgi:hypothetical protein